MPPFGHPQVDSLQKLALLASPGVMLVFCCEPELSDGFLTGTHPFHNFVEFHFARIIILICHNVAHLDFTEFV